MWADCGRQAPGVDAESIQDSEIQLAADWTHIADARVARAFTFG
jgi:hypothetical protein